MANRIIALADAVTSAINAATFTTSFTATRKNRPEVDLTALSNLVVTVTAGDVQRDSMSRAKERFDATILIALQKQADSKSAEDAVLTLADEIADWCFGKDYGSFQHIQTRHEPLIQADNLNETGVITSVIALQFIAII